MPRLARWPLSILLLLVVTALTHAQAKLEWKFKEGDRFIQETAALLGQKMKVAGQTGNQEFEHFTQATFTVKKVHPDGSVELEQKLDKLKATSRLGAGSPPGSGHVRSLEDAVFTITLNPKREVIKFEGYDDLIKRVSGDDANSAKAIRELLKPETLKRTAEEAFGFLPDKPVTKGDKWDRKIEASLGPLGTLIAGHTYTYDGPEMKDGKSLHKISVASTLAYTPPKEETPGFPFKITKGEVKAEEAAGTIWFDAETGRMDSSETKLKLKGTLTVGVAGQSHDLVIEQEQMVRTKITTR